jgi:hypothetical protein
VPRRDDAASRADRARSRPPALADAVERAGYPFRVGCAPPEDELGRLWARVRTLPSDDAERLVVGEMFATLNVRAMLPAMRTAVREWRPDVIVREHAEFASLVAAEEAGVPHLQVGISLAATHMRIVWIAAKPVEAWGTGLADRIAETPCLTLFPASLEDPEVAGPPTRLRFRDPAADAAGAPLPDWWAGDGRPLAYGRSTPRLIAMAGLGLLFRDLLARGGAGAAIAPRKGGRGHASGPGGSAFTREATASWRVAAVSAGRPKRARVRRSRRRLLVA